MERGRFSRGEWVVIAAGVVLFVASFLVWYRLPGSAVLTPGVGRTAKAWDQGLFPIAVIPALVGLLIATQVVVARTTEVRMPDRLAGLTLGQLRGVAAVFGVVIMVGELLTDHRACRWRLAKGLGLWLSLLASILLLVATLVADRSATVD
jgi:hypothetical protein